MRCCASPTTSIAAEAFAAQLLRVAFAPLAKPLGFFGEAVVDAVATAAACAERGGITGEIERALMRASGERS